MDERKIEKLLRDLIWAESDEGETPVDNIEDFVQAGICTNNRGLIVRFQDGSEFQLTIVQSAEPDEDEDEPDDTVVCLNCGTRLNQDEGGICDRCFAPQNTLGR